MTRLHDGSVSSRVLVRVHLAVLVALLLLTLGLYAGAIDGPFVIDDWNSIVYNPTVRTPSPASEFLRSNRPLTELSLALDRAAAGLEPRRYHLVNIALHGLNGALVYALVLLTLNHAGQTLSFVGRSPAAVAAGAAFLFVAHPLQTESVAYISSRSELLAACFYLLTVLLYAVAGRTRRRVTRAACAAAVPLSTAAALASKEMAVTIPAALFLYGRCFPPAGNLRDVRFRWLLIALTLPPLGVAAVVFLPALLVSEGAGLTFTGFTPWQYGLSQLGVVVHYLRLVLIPVGLSFDYDWPLSRSPWTFAVALPFAILVALVVVAIRRVRVDPIFSFGILWVLLVLVPTSSVIPIADLVAEHRMYLPLAGVAFLGAAWAWRLPQSVGQRFGISADSRPLIFGLLVLATVAGLSGLTVSRAAKWGDALALYEDAASKGPRNPRARLNLGVIYLNLDRLDAALTEMRAAQRLLARKASTHANQDALAFLDYNLGVVLQRLDQSAEASVYLERALRRGTRYGELHPGAQELLRTIREEWRGWSGARQTQWLVEAARAHLRLGQIDHARAVLLRALRRDPKQTEAAALLARLPAPQNTFDKSP